MIIACAGCHLHWLAVALLPVALWVFKIFRHKGKKCPCDCHEKRDNGTIICPACKTKSYQKIWNSNARVCRRGDCGYAEYASGSTEQSKHKRKYLTGGNIKRGGVNPMPTSPKPPAKPFGRK